MTKTLIAISIVLSLAHATSAQETRATPNVAGTWNMGLQGGHVVPVALTLEQKGTAVTGSILLPSQRAGERVEVALRGELSGVALTLSGTIDAAAGAGTIEIGGTVNDDGSMEGTLNGPHGTVAWTAERLKERKQ